MPSQSPASCFTACCHSFKQLWFVSVQSLDLYLECCQLSNWTVRTKTACKLLAAAVSGRQQLAKLVADIVHTQPRIAISKHLSENTSRHEKLLVNMFSCLNPFSAKVILTRISLVQFLSLDEANISSLFPWLPGPAAAHIAAVTATSFQLSQFVNTKRMEMEGQTWDTMGSNMEINVGQMEETWDNSTMDGGQMSQTKGTMSNMDRHVREMEVNRIMFGDRLQMDRLDPW